MGPGFPRLLGDIGGTNARRACQSTLGGTMQFYASYPSDRFDSVQSVIEQFLTDRQ